MEEIEELLGTVPLDTIYSAGKTSRRLCPSGVTTWTERGSDSRTIASSGNEKECIPVMATIRADGKRGPLYILAHSKTALVETSQIGDVTAHHRGHSDSGWMTSETYARYLHIPLRRRMGH
jgi:hypothetical protein